MPKRCLSTNKVDECSCCAEFVGYFGGCSAQYFSLQCKIVWKRNRFCIDARINFGMRKGIHRDTERYTGVHGDTHVSKCIPVYHEGIRRDTFGYMCIPVYPCVSACTAWHQIFFLIYGKFLRAQKLSFQT